MNVITLAEKIWMITSITDFKLINERGHLYVEGWKIGKGR